MRRIATVALVVLLCGCGGPQQYDHPQRPELVKAIHQMGDAEDDPFVIVEDTEKHKYVQFAHQPNGTFVIDVPLMTLDEDERARAETYFARYDIAIVQDKAKDPKTDEEFTFSSYQREYTWDKVDEVANIALGVFAEVYQLKNHRLAITKGWE